MHNSFISIVGVINPGNNFRQLTLYLTNIYGLLEAHFSDYEIILVNNSRIRDFDELIEELPANLRQSVYLLNLSSTINRNHAVLAGFDRANGDYTLLFELEFAATPSLILDLYNQTQAGFDIVYLQAKQRQTGLRFRLFYKLFYSILRNYSNLRIDEKAHHTRIISRRALNSILRMRENHRYMKAIYALVGFPTTSISVDQPLQHAPEEGFSEQFRTSLVAISSFTTFLRSLLLWIFLISLVFLGFVVFNAVKVKFTGIDIFGSHQEPESGWTFLVVMISIFFAITCLNLYIMSVYLSNIYFEIKQRPLYIIESIKRF